MTTNKARLRQVAKKAPAPKRELVVFWYDAENEFLYTRPEHEEGAELVTPAQLEQAQLAGTVILVRLANTPYERQVYP